MTSHNKQVYPTISASYSGSSLNPVREFQALFQYQCHAVCYNNQLATFNASKRLLPQAARCFASYSSLTFSALFRIIQQRNNFLKFSYLISYKTFLNAYREHETAVGTFSMYEQLFHMHRRSHITRPLFCSAGRQLKK